MEAGDLEAAREATEHAVSALDKAESKGVLHKNNVARRKSRLMKQLFELEQQNA
jgi:small subunit ribosomal protein S20